VEKRRFKNQLYGQFARVGKALGSPARIELLDLLAQGPRTVESLAAEAGLTVGNASAHLQILKEARLAEGRRDGLFVRYRLADDSVAALLQALRTVAERRLAEIDRLVEAYFGHRDQLEPVGFDDLRRRLRDGTAIVVDVRPTSEYVAGHIGGAISIPHDQIDKRLEELPRSKDIVAYCRGPYCVFADEAVATLRGHRRKAFRLDGGFPEWQTAGLPTEGAAE